MILRLWPAICLWWLEVSGHHTWFYGDGIVQGEEHSKRPGLMVSFENPVYSNGYFVGFDGWKEENRHYGAENITFIIRVEFKRETYRENRLARHFRRYWLPGVRWVELNVRHLYVHWSNLSIARTRNRSHLDIWVEPTCFLRHNGISRIYRISRSLRIDVEHLRWLAKINYRKDENYRERELMELSKKVSQIKGIQCSWLHPRNNKVDSMMVRFFKGEIPPKGFFSQKYGYTNWDFLNNEYQVFGAHYLRGWNRALLDFESGLYCQESLSQISDRYQGLPGVRFVYTDSMKECRFAYQIVLAFNRKSVSPERIREYRRWNNLNHVYGVIHVSFELLEDYKVVLEFEPGLYTHHQMKAIRDEYLKLPGIRFGWVLGKKAREVSTIILHFNIPFLRQRLSLKNYNHWDSLNKRYSADISILDETKSRAYIRFPEGRFSDLELKAILRKYRHLPGITSVRMDKQQTRLSSYWKNNNETSPYSKKRNKHYRKKSDRRDLTSKRTLRSWLRLSHGNVRKLRKPSDWDNDNKILQRNRDATQWSSRCIID